jgi:hypothetical protein
MRRGACTGRCALRTYKQAVLVSRWFLDTRMSALARDNASSVSTADGHWTRALAVVAARRPTLRGALVVETPGHTHEIVDGTPDAAPTDLHPPGLHVERTYGGAAITSITAGRSRSLRSGRMATVDIPRAAGSRAALTRICFPDQGQGQWTALWASRTWAMKANSEPSRFPSRTRRTRALHYSAGLHARHGVLRCLGERVNSLVKTTYKALRRYRGCPRRHRRRRPGPGPPRTRPHHMIRTELDPTTLQDVTQKGSVTSAGVSACICAGIKWSP